MHFLPFFVSFLTAYGVHGAAVNRRATPTDISQVVSRVSSILAASPTGTALVAAFSSAGIPTIPIPSSPPTGTSSYNNTNPNPNSPIYPQKSPSDAPYSLPESSLRGAIYIPPGFKYGSTSAVPIICVPGTGVYGATYYDTTNFAEHLAATGAVDPVWLNVPNYLWGDAQVNSEYVAYAMNYIAGVIPSGRTVAVLAWSQGNINTQWALKYWPSTRAVVSDHIAISPDYHGTVLASAASPLEAGPLVPPALTQQAYTSQFIATLRAAGGDSAYVPTTTVYSGTDEVVQPQQGALASAFLLDARAVGVSNTYLQTTCPGLPAGSFVTHEGVGYNPVTFALILDAVSHAGPGSLSRVNTASLCPLYAAAAFTPTDVLEFEASIPFAASTALLYNGPRYAFGSEPAIAAYAA